MFRSLLVLSALSGAVAQAEDKVFSGPQKGEKLASFKAIGIYDALADKEIDVMKEVGEKPTVLIFVHKKSRPGFALLRSIAGYARKQGDKLKPVIVWLEKDRNDAFRYLRGPAKRYWNVKIPFVYSKDGAEGPGAYGLNREMELTVIVGNKKKVTDNFALVQPGLQADAKKIGDAIAKVVGVKAPTQEEMVQLGSFRPGNALGRMMSYLIRKNATEEEVKAGAERIEKAVSQNKGLQRQLGRLSKIRLRQKVGTEHAQKYLKEWAKKYGQ